MSVAKPPPTDMDDFVSDDASPSGAEPRSWAFWALAVIAGIAIFACVRALTGCTSAQRKAVVHVVADNCERLDLPEPICVAVEDLAPLLAVLLAAQKAGEDAVVQVRDAHGVSHEFVVPLARIPGAVGAVSGAAIGAANRSESPNGSNSPKIPEGSR